jgi:hypothetical protein
MNQREHELEVCLAAATALGCLHAAAPSEFVDPEANGTRGAPLDLAFMLDAEKVVVEHSLLPAFEHQRRDDVHFTKLMGSMSERLSLKMPVSGDFDIQVPANVVDAADGIETMQEDLANWVLRRAPSLVPESGDLDAFICEVPPGLPFEVTLVRALDGNGNVSFTRVVPSDYRESRKREAVRLVRGKWKKLRLAQTRPHPVTTVFACEFTSMALDNQVVIASALHHAAVETRAPIPTHVFALDTRRPEWRVWALHGPDRPLEPGVRGLRPIRCRATDMSSLRRSAL